MFDFMKKKEIVLDVEGMMCEKCAGRVKKALEAVKGVTAEISLAEKTAKVTCPEAADAEALAKAVTEAGYPAKVRSAQ